MGGICPCSRSVNKVKLPDTDAQQNDESTSMLSSGESALRVGKQPYGTMAGATGERAKHVKHETLKNSERHNPGKEKDDGVSGVDDTGNEHHGNDNGYTRGDDGDNDPNDNDSQISNQQTSQATEPAFLATSSETLVVKNGGFGATNGEYRWFLHAQKWCLFTETGTNYSIEKNVKVSKVYKQLKQLKSKNALMKWNDNITMAWVISDMDTTHVYYAAPMEFADKLPSNFGWVSIHGSEPVPVIVQNQTHDSQGPDEEDSVTFSDSSMRSLRGRHPSSKVSNIGTLIEEEDGATLQESPKAVESNHGDDDSEDGDAESDVSEMSN